MAQYAMVIKNTNNKDIIFKANANSLEEATIYFSKLKQMSREEFNKLFLVTEIK